MTTIRVPSLTGARIIGVRVLSADEQQEIGARVLGYQEPLVLELDTGVRLVALRDQEGNSFGCFHGLFRGKQFDISEES